MSLKHRIIKLEACKSGLGQPLIEALNQAKERRLDRRPEPTITEAELNQIIAMNNENSMTAKIARGPLRRLYRLNHEH